MIDVAQSFLPPGVHPALAGTPFFPCGTNKRPAVKEWRPFADRLPSEAEWSSWKTHTGPWGMPCGPLAGFVVLDFDGAEGKKLFEEKFNGSLPPTALTPSGGHHAFFAYPQDKEIARLLKNAVRFFPGLDVRTHGGYVVIPSGYKDGRRWIQPPDIQAPPLPEWFLDALKKDSCAKTMPPTEPDGLPAGVTTGTRNDTAAKIAGRYLGRGNSEAETFLLMVPWAKKCVPVMKEGELRDTIRSIAEAERAKRQGVEVTVLESMRMRTVQELLDDESLDEPEPILKGLAALGELTVLGGPAKAMKSWTVKRIGLCLTSGKPWLGFDVPRPFRTGYFSAEGRETRLRARFQKLIAFTETDAEGLALMSYISTQGKLKIDTEAGARTFLRLIEPLEVVIIDPLYRFIAEGDENSHRDQRVVQDLIDGIKESGKAVIIVHHTRKPGNVDAGIAELRGAGLDNFTDGVIMLGRKDKGKDDRFTARFTPRNEEPIPDMELKREGVILYPVEPSEAVFRQVTTGNVVDSLGVETMTTPELCEAISNNCRVSLSTAKRAVNRAFEDGRIDRKILVGVKGKPWGYHVAQAGFPGNE